MSETAYQRIEVITGPARRRRSSLWNRMKGLSAPPRCNSSKRPAGEAGPQ